MQEDDENAAAGEEDEGMTRRPSHRGQYLYLTFPTLTMRKLVKPLHMRKHAKVMSSLLLGKTNRSARGMKP